jgi:hypothetical protein
MTDRTKGKVKSFYGVMRVTPWGNLTMNLPYPLRFSEEMGFGFIPVFKSMDELKKKWPDALAVELIGLPDDPK